MATNRHPGSEILRFTTNPSSHPVGQKGSTMRKYLIAVTAVTALAAVPSSGLATTPINTSWGGYSSTSHYDNAASPHYWTHFGSSGAGNSKYCADARWARTAEGQAETAATAAMRQRRTCCY